MANYVGSSRSNYFKVRDEAAFRAAMSPFDLDIWGDQDQGFALSPSSMNDDGCWPSFMPVPDVDGNPTDAEVEVWFPELVAQHLADDAIAVFQSIGSENRRYLCGYSVAINHRAEHLQVSIDDIYALAKQRFGVEPTVAAY